jgi:hypothetical protein
MNATSIRPACFLSKQIEAALTLNHEPEELYDVFDPFS